MIFTEIFLPHVSGFTKRLEETINCLVKRGDKVLLFAPVSSVKSYPGIEIVRMSGLPALYPNLVLAWPHPKIFFYLKRFAPDIVHLADPSCLGVWGMICAKVLKIPVVTSFHTNLIKYRKYYSIHRLIDPYLGIIWETCLKAVHKNGNKIISSSPESAKFLEQLISRSVDVWRGSLDRVLFSPSHRSQEIRKKYHVSKDEKIILYVGRLSLEKSVIHLKALLDLDENVWLWIVGDGPLKDELTLHLSSKRTVFFGLKTGEELACLYASADVFVMPSSTETLGFVTMEAMSSGLPVVAAGAGGTLGLVSHGVNGYLYNPENLLELKNFVTLLLNNDQLRREFSANAIKSSETFSSWAEETDKLRNYYLEAINDKREACLT